MYVQSEGAGNSSLQFERFDSERQLIQRSALAPFAGQFGTALRKQRYFAWWVAEGGKVIACTLPTTGSIAAAEPQELFDPKDTNVFLTTSDNDWWAVTMNGLYEPSATHSWDPQKPFADDLVGFDGAALEVFARSRDHGNVLLGSTLLAGPTTDFEQVIGAPSLYEAHFSERSGNRALLLGYERQFFKDTPQDAVLSVVDVTGEEEAAGGAGGAGAGGQINGTGGSEQLAGAPATGGTEALPAEGGAATIPSNAGDGTGATQASGGRGGTNSAGTAGQGGKPSLGGDAIEGGVANEGDDIDSPSNPGGPHTSKGCGCRAVGTDVSGNRASALPLLLLGALAVRRRRIIPS
jgi:MYXO-CTERM domain-containing protein